MKAQAAVDEVFRIRPGPEDQGYLGRKDPVRLGTRIFGQIAGDLELVEVVAQAQVGLLEPCLWMSRPQQTLEQLSQRARHMPRAVTRSQS